MHPDTTYEITTMTQRPDPLAYTPPAARSRMLPEELPAGVQMVTLPGGYSTLAYTQPPAPTSPPQPVVQPIPRWAKTTALLAPTVGTGVAVAGVGLSYAAPGLIAMTDALWSAVALIAAGGAAAAALIKRCRRQAPAHITQHVTATGLFGRATGTINHH
ncbi:hypothetical protein [Streptomyces albidus (ex Kaewkla and Franco 2022)]|uniref:hypothetical protein n=1 Tax=Streptomyces albidus (ex Kaewkla and Franco 2022) TaxID=722709 RepID=UPI0015EF55A8|nr:hypothetical protein [Streptomyces albidus (ex Kaewkla and Franco 2022)]